MQYSQKYCLVFFTQPLADGNQFHTKDWPSHITIADVFAIDIEQSGIIRKLETLCSQLEPVIVVAQSESVLGTTPVILLSESAQLLNMHSRVVLLLEKCRAVFNNPEFTRSGYIGHSTIQANGSISMGESVSISSISLVDMYPNEDWEQREVLATFQLSK